jgi:hypothetical protein
MANLVEALEAYLLDLQTNDNSDYYWVDTYSEYVLRRPFEPYGDNDAIKKAEKAALYGDFKTYTQLMFGLGVLQYITESGERGKNGASTTQSTKSKRPTLGQMKEAIKKGQCPRGVERIDEGRLNYEQPHVHFKDGSALGNMVVQI